MQPTNNDQQPVKSTKKKKLNLTRYLKFIIPIVGVVAMVTIIIYLINSGIIYIGIKSPLEKIFVRQPVCDELVEEYVKASKNEEFNMAMEIDKLASKIKDDDLAKKDANCQYIKLSSSYRDNRFEDALEHAKTIKLLLGEGGSVDIRLPVFGNIDSMIDMIQALIDIKNKPAEGGFDGVAN